MKINLKKLLSFLFAIFICCFSASQSDAAFFSRDNSTIYLNSRELVALRMPHTSVNANDNRFTITNLGHPENIDVHALPECYLSQIDFAKPVALSQTRYLDATLSLMSVTLMGEIYGTGSVPYSWSCISVHDNMRRQENLFKVCEALNPSQVAIDITALKSLFRHP